MKKILLILSLSLSPLLAFCQTQNDYERVMGRMIHFYNQKQADSLRELFAYNNSWTSETIDNAMQEFGKIVSYKFMKVDSTDLDVHSRPMGYFAAVSEKKMWGRKTNAMSISLNDDNKISGIRFLTKSDHTDSMLQEYHYLYTH